jgi:hypothetical protein
LDIIKGESIIKHHLQQHSISSGALVFSLSKVPSSEVRRILTLQRGMYQKDKEAMTIMGGNVQEQKTTVGEELYLVHLRRSAGESRNGSPRKRSHSVGEELWEVHIKRSRGSKLDLDTENTVSFKQEDDIKRDSPVDVKGCQYNLRKRGSSHQKE